MIVKARYDGRVFIPQGPVDLPVGSEVEIPVEPGQPAPAQAPGLPDPAAAENASERPLMRLAELVKRFPNDPDWPEDGAIQHDHYLYGTPKRANP